SYNHHTPEKENQVKKYYHDSYQQPIFFNNDSKDKIVICCSHIVTYIRIPGPFSEYSPFIYGKFRIISLCNSYLSTGITIDIPVDTAFYSMDTSRGIGKIISNYIG